VSIGPYDLTQSVRRSRSVKNDIHGPSTISIQLHLPCFALPTYWTRYNLSQEDVLNISDHISASVYWLMAMLLGIDVSASAVRPSFASPDTVLVSSKAIAYRKIEKILNYSFHPHPTLEMGLASIDHVPALPRIIVDKAQLDMLQGMLYPNLTAFETNRISTCFHHNGMQWVARACEGDAIFAQRLIPLEVFNLSGKYNGSHSSRPLLLALDGATHVLAEESCLFSL